MTIVRTYKVVLFPTNDPTAVHEPMLVQLRYDDNEARRINPTEARAFAEATKRAIKLERRNNGGGTHLWGADIGLCDLDAASVTLVREQLVTL